MAPPRKPRRPCAICGEPVKRPTKVYCSRACRDEALRRAGGNGGTFTPGQTPHNRLPVGAVTTRTRSGRDDGPRAWVKVAEPNVWRPRAVLVWEGNHGPIPRGMVVHHENRDTLDDSPSNLSLTSRAGHLTEHRPEFESRRKQAAASAARRRSGSATRSRA